MKMILPFLALLGAALPAGACPAVVRTLAARSYATPAQTFAAPPPVVSPCPTCPAPAAAAPPVVADPAPVVAAPPAVYQQPATVIRQATVFQAAPVYSYGASATVFRHRSFVGGAFAAPAVFAAPAPVVVPAAAVNVNVVGRRGLFGGFRGRQVIRTRTVIRGR